MYHPWKADTIDLTAYIGKPVTIKFQVAGCIFGGHYGVAYVDINFINPSVGVLETTNQSFELFPNPAKQQTQIRLKDPLNSTDQLMLMDQLGRVVNALFIRSAYGWDIVTAELPSGVYTAIVNSKKTELLNV